MKNERAVCDRNSDLNGNLLVWITSKQLKLHQKHKMALIQYCLSATWRLSFLSHFWAEKSPSLMNGARFCIQICRNDGLILDLHCRQKNFHLRKCCIFPVFDPRNSLFGEIASYVFDSFLYALYGFSMLYRASKPSRIEFSSVKNHFPQRKYIPLNHQIENNEKMRKKFLRLCTPLRVAPIGSLI